MVFLRYDGVKVNLKPEELSKLQDTTGRSDGCWMDAMVVGTYVSWFCFVFFFCVFLVGVGQGRLNMV